LIFASQFHVMVDDRPRGSGLDNLLSIPEAVYKGLSPAEGSRHQQAALIGLLTIAAIVLWGGLARGRARTLPAPLVAVVLAAAVATALGLPIRRVELPADFWAAVAWPTADTWRRLTDGAILVAGLTLAAVASAETLLCAAAVDRMHTGPRTRYNRELFAQGVGNLVSGTLGGLPITGVIVRSATNVQAGARTRASAVLHGAWLLTFVSLFPAVLERVPTASLAAVLVYTGYKLVDVPSLRKLWGQGPGEAAIYAVTVGTIVAVDLLTGVLAGVALSVLKLAYTFSHLAVRVEDDPDRRRAVLHFRGTATFISLPKLAAALETVPHDRELHVRLDDLGYIDHACLELLLSWERQYRAAGGSLTIDWQSLEARFRQPLPRAGAGEPSAEKASAAPFSADSAAGRPGESRAAAE
jgi:MFS superfamily sulfate permease-like transporter